MVVTREHANTSAALPVPYSNRLVVRSGDDPRVLVVEHRGADVVEVAEEGEDASLLLVVPHFDFVVVATGDEERLLVVKADATDRTVVLVVFFYERAHAVVP